MKIMRCHDCGEKPERVRSDPSYVVIGCGCNKQTWRIDPEVWNAIQRRKRMKMKWELFVVEAGSPEGVRSIERTEEWLEVAVTHFFGPADGEEVGDA